MYTNGICDTWLSCRIAASLVRRHCALFNIELWTSLVIIHCHIRKCNTNPTKWLGKIICRQKGGMIKDSCWMFHVFRVSDVLKYLIWGYSSIMVRYNMVTNAHWYDSGKNVVETERIEKKQIESWFSCAIGHKTAQRLSPPKAPTKENTRHLTTHSRTPTTKDEYRIQHCIK